MKSCDLECKESSLVRYEKKKRILISPIYARPPGRQADTVTKVQLEGKQRLSCSISSSTLTSENGAQVGEAFLS